MSITNEIWGLMQKHAEYFCDDEIRALGQGKFNDAAEAIAQMFCDKFMQREYDFVSGMYRVSEFCADIRARIKSLVNGSGFTEQQIINSLEKLKAK